MTAFFSAVLAMSGLGIVLSLVLGLAAKVFYVYTDPRTETIMDILPGANCGGCGYAGCREYAEAIVEKGESPNKCVAAGADVTEQVCCLIGVEPALGERKIAKIFCQGDHDKAWRRFEYSGAKDCYAAIVSTGGDKACKYGCVGLGTCVKACPFDALSMGENGLPVVNQYLCTGCGCCTSACPRNLPRLIPINQPTANLCSTHDSGKVVKSVCSVGCISCGMCIKKCPEQAVVMQNKIPVVLPEKCKGHKVCVDKCPTGSMQDLQAQEEPEYAPAAQS